MSIAAFVSRGEAPRAPERNRFLAWPGWPHLLHATGLGLANGLWFLLVFAGCDFLTAQRVLRVPIHFSAELAIPFVAEMTAVYMSIYLLFVAAPFILRTRAEFRAAIATLAVMIGIAGVGFLLVPAALAYPPVRDEELGIWAGMFHLADALNLTYNLLPSLHVALTVACVSFFTTRIAGAGRMLLWAWAAAVAFSALFTHQHHVLDVVTGWILALLCFKFVYQRLLRSGASSGPASSETERAAQAIEPAGRSAPAEQPSVLGAWQIACASRELGSKPAKVTVQDRPIVLFRDGEGRAVALEDRCAHRNAPLSLGRVCGGRLQCAYHGWEYDAEGRVADIPALPRGTCPAAGLRVPKYRTIEQDGFIWLSLAETAPDAPPPRFAHFMEAGWTSFVMKTRFHAKAEACLENFLDCPHATFVHRFWFRSPTARPVKAIVRTRDDGAEAEFFEEPREKSLVWWLLAPRGGEMRHTDRFIAPSTSRVDYRFPNGWHYIITSSCTEITSDETEVFTVISFKCGKLGPLVRLYFEPLSRFIIRQDVRILAAQQANIARFGSARFANTGADLLGPHIVAWREALRAGKVPPRAGEERHVLLYL